MKIIVMTLFMMTSLYAQDFEFDQAKGRAIPKFMAQVKLIKGKVFKLLPSENREELQVGDRLSKGETLVTQELSFVKILMVDDTLLAIGPKSELKLSEFNFVDKTDRQIVYDIIKGQILGMVKNKAKEGEIVFRTKLSSMGVRGTEILINHQAIQGKEISEFALLSGHAELIEDNKNRYDLMPSERMIFVQDPLNQKKAKEKLVLKDAEFDYLKAKDMNEEKDFKPFLPYYVLQKADKTSPLYPMLRDETSSEENPVTESKSKREDKAKWQENLKKLNEKLRDNQKRD